VLTPPDQLMLFCGMSIEQEDSAVAYIRTGRSPLGTCRCRPLSSGTGRRVAMSERTQAPKVSGLQVSGQRNQLSVASPVIDDGGPPTVAGS
jgi:hypothetical protein